MKKVVTQAHRGKNGTNIDFRAERKAHSAPDITGEGIGDNGERIYLLANGRTQSAESYDAMWNKPKGIVLPKGTKDNNSLWGTNQIKHKR